jgi:hypothetical protein
LKNRWTANPSYKCIATPAAHASGEFACDYRVNGYSVVYKAAYIAHPVTGVAAFIVPQQTDRRSNVDRPKVYIVVAVFASGILFRPYLTVEARNQNQSRLVRYASREPNLDMCAIPSGNREWSARSQSSNRGKPNMQMVFKFLFTAGFVFAQVILHAVTAYSAWTVCLVDGIEKIPALSRRLLRHT